MNKSEFFDLADLVFDCEASAKEILFFEDLVEQNPEWMDEWVDQKTFIQNALGVPPVEASPNFDPSLLARWRAEKVKLSFNYWAPAAIAAVAAAVGLFAVLQVLSSPIESATFGTPDAEAKLEDKSSVTFPTLREPFNR